jgi:hypothetical protein
VVHRVKYSYNYELRYSGVISSMFLLLFLLVLPLGT